MNHLTNTPSLNNSMNVDSLEMNEAKRRMGTVNNQTMGTQMTNTTSVQGVPGLSSSTSIDNNEINRAKTKMNQSSSTTPLK